MIDVPNFMESCVGAWEAGTTSKHTSGSKEMGQMAHASVDEVQRSREAKGKDVEETGVSILDSASLLVFQGSRYCSIAP